MTLVNDGLEQARPFFERPHLEVEGKNQLKIEGAKSSLKCLLEQIDKTPWDGINKAQAQELLKVAANSANVKKGLIMKSLRAALLGSMQGPDLISTWSLLTRIGEDRNRICRCL